MRLPVTRRLLLALPLAAIASPARANGEIMVINAFVRPPLVPSVPVGALYMTLMNHGAAGDKLIAISSPVAASVELHESKEENGVSSMRAVEALELPAGGMLELKPGGYHAMLVGIKTPMKKGDSVAFTLTFETAGEIAMTAQVGETAAMHEHEAPKE